MKHYSKSIIPSNYNGEILFRYKGIKQCVGKIVSNDENFITILFVDHDIPEVIGSTCKFRVKHFFNIFELVK